MATLNIGILSKQKLIRKALLSLLMTLPVGGDMCVTLDADSVSDALKRMASSKPTILLIDCDDGLDWINCVHKVRTISPSTKSLLFARDPAEEFVVQAASSGAWGVVPKEADPQLLQEAIQRLIDGEMWFSNQTMSAALQSVADLKPFGDSPLGRLTAREGEVLFLLCKGYRNKEIACKLFLSVNTVRRYTETIYRKLGVNSRVEAILRYASYPEPATFLVAKEEPVRA